jgi:hypothetical protein
MILSKVTRRFTAWIACFAILLAALAPSISHAMAGAGSTSAWIEICSIAGTRFVPADDGGSPGLPSNPLLTLPVIDGKPVLPSLYYQASRPLFAWASAQSRAPPALS